VDFLAGSDIKVVIAFWLGVGLVLMTVIMLSVILLKRETFLHRERVHAQAERFWRPILEGGGDLPASGIPTLSAAQLSGFLSVWNDLHEQLHGETTPHLSRVAQGAGLEDHLHRVLGGGDFPMRLVSIIALGHVKNGRSFDRVAPFIHDRSSIVSLCAARALMQIDQVRAVSMFVPQIVHRSDWSQGSIAAILREADDPAVSNELVRATLHATEDVAPRLIRFLANVSEEAVAPIIRKSLCSSTDERLISTCLQVMSRPAQLDCVRPLHTHPRWHVRMQAAVTLGRLGSAADEALLVPMLGDSQWWVRYRAAQALLSLPTVGRPGLHRIRDAQTDPYAHDIIVHVLAETALKDAA